MPKVEIGLCPIRSHVDFTVLEGTHSSRIDIDVGIKFLQGNLEPMAFQQSSDGGTGQSLAQTGNYTTCYKNILRHFLSPFPTGDLHPNLPLTKTSTPTARSFFSQHQNPEATNQSS